MAAIKSLPSNLNLAVQESATLTWTIDAFTELGSKISSAFSPPNSQNEFKLGFCHLSSSFNVNNKHTFIFLIYNGHQEEAYFRYRVSVLDANGEKVYNREYIWHYNEFDDSGIDSVNLKTRITSYVLHKECAKLLVNGGLKLYCEVDIMGEKSVPSVAESFGKLSKNYEDLLESGKWADFVVHIGGKQFKVHKTVLGTRSPVFASMFEHAETKEMKEGRVLIEDVVEVDVFELFIRYIYTGKIEGFDEHADELFVAADKYQLDDLKSICEQSLISTLTAESVCGVLLLSDMHNAEQLKSKCIEYIVKHAKEVMKTEGWKQLGKSKRSDLVTELFEKLAIKDDDD